ncbi:MAG TPA: hypothetical protein VIJ34_00085 [Acidimicrobiales bacterium]
MEQPALASVVKRGSLWIAVALVLLTLFTLAAVHTVPRTADNATVLLEGDAMVHGSVLLHHWLLSLDSFWTIDAVFYALGVAIAGLNYNLLFVIPALLATCVVIVAIAFVRSCSRSRAWIPGAIAVALLLALPSPDFAYYLFQGPWHVGTTLWSLVAYWLITRRAFGWSWVVAVIFLSLALLGDLVALAIGVAPCLIAGILWGLRDRTWRRGFSAISCGVASVALAFDLRWIAAAIGTFSYAYRNVPLSWHTAGTNLSSLGNRLMGFLGVDNIDLPGVTNGNSVERVAHLLGAAAVLVGLGAAIYRSVKRPVSSVDSQDTEQRATRLNDLLLAGVLGSLLLFVAGSPTNRLTDTTFLTPAVVFASILAGMGVTTISQRVLNRRRELLKPVAALLGSALAVVAIGAYTTAFATVLQRPATTELPKQLGSFLIAHHLTSGLGDYPTSSLVVAATGGTAKVRPLIPAGSQLLIADIRQVAIDWYKGVRFNFFVYNFQHPWRDVTAARAVRTFGAYSQAFTVGPFRVLVWRHALAVPPPVAVSATPLRIR